MIFRHGNTQFINISEELVFVAQFILAYPYNWKADSLLLSTGSADSADSAENSCLKWGRQLVCQAGGKSILFGLSILPSPK